MAGIGRTTAVDEVGVGAWVGEGTAGIETGMWITGAVNAAEVGVWATPAPTPAVLSEDGAGVGATVEMQLGKGQSTINRMKGPSLRIQKGWVIFECRTILVSICFDLFSWILSSDAVLHQKGGVHLWIEVLHLWKNGMCLQFVMLHLVEGRVHLLLLMLPQGMQEEAIATVTRNRANDTRTICIAIDIFMLPP